MKFTCKKLLLLVFIDFASFSSAKSKKINIVFVGDSITEGGANLKNKKRVSSVSVSNHGFSVHTTPGFLPVSNTGFPKVMQAVNVFAADKEAELVFSIMIRNKGLRHFRA